MFFEDFSTKIDQNIIVDQASFIKNYDLNKMDYYNTGSIINTFLYSKYAKLIGHKSLLLDNINNDLNEMEVSILDGNINLYPNYAELYGLKNMVILSPKLEYLLKSDSERNLKGSGKCGAAILGGFLSGGLAGCKVGIKIGSFFGPQSGLAGCVSGGFIGAVGTALLGASKFCGDEQ